MLKSINIPLDDKISNLKFEIGLNKVCIDNDKIQLLDSGIIIIIDKDTLIIQEGEGISKEIIKQEKIKEEIINEVIETVDKVEIKENKSQQLSIRDDKSDDEEDEENSKERNQLKINKARENMRSKLVDALKGALKGLFEVTKASIRDHNANILLKPITKDREINNKEEPIKIKMLYSKDYSPTNRDVISGYFTLDYKRYDDSDFYLFAIESDEEVPHFIVITKYVMNSILLKKNGKGSIYRFNIKVNRYGESREVYDTADLIDGISKIDLIKYHRNLEVVYYYLSQLHIKKRIMDFNNCANFEFLENIDEVKKKINDVAINNTSFSSSIRHGNKDINLIVYYVCGEYSAYIKKVDLEKCDIFIFMIVENDSINYYSFNKQNINNVINKEGKYIYAINDCIIKDATKESMWNIEDIINKNMA